MNILDKIVARKREEIAFSKSKISVEELKNSEFFGRKTFSLKKSVKDILFYSAACALVAVFGILIYSASQKVAFQADASPSAPKPIIIIDAGHGGEDGGAVADDGGAPAAII